MYNFRAVSIVLILAMFPTSLAAGEAPGLSKGRSPTELTMEVEIDAPISKVWNEFSRIGDIYLNSPTVSRSHLSSTIEGGIGATRHMEMSIKEGATLDERVIAWTDGEYMALEVYRIQGMTGVQTMGGDFRLEGRGTKTLLTSTLNYSMTNRFFGLMNRMIMKRKFVKLWASVLVGYKTHIETGVEVTAETDLDLEQARIVPADTRM